MKWILLLIISVYLTQYASCRVGKNSRFYWKTPGYAMPWLKGPNVCAVEEVIGSRKRYYSECMAYMPRKICEKPTFIRYHCCTGFEILEDGSRGCQGVVPMGDLMDTAKNLYLNDFRKAAKKSGLEETLINGGPYTVFGLHNNAFRGIPKDIGKKLSHKNRQKNLLLHHMVNDRYLSRDLVNNLELPSLYKDNATIRINRYSNGVLTANCARIILPNQPATNGLIHVTEKVVKPIKDRGTVMDVLFNDPRFGELVTALIVTNLGNELRDSNSQLTLFAPTDTAFRNAPQEVVDRILGDKEVLARLLKYHMLDFNACSAAILGPVQHKTKEGQKINITCDINDKMNVDGVPVAEVDIVATNGVVHVLDHILIPNSAKSLGEVLSELNLERFREYLQQAGAGDILEGKAEGNYTIFAPSQEALDKLTVEQKRTLQSQPNAVKKVFQYHIAPGKITTKKFIGRQTVASNQGPEASIRISVYNKGFGINGARIISSDHAAGNGIIHIVDKVLFPPEGTTMDKIKEGPEFSTFLSLLQTAVLDEVLFNIDGNFTVFAPTNDAFDSLESSYLEALMLDPVQLEKFLKYHILEKTIYSSAIQPKLQYRFKTSAKEWIKVKQDTEEEPILINTEAKILGDEIESKNGIIYKIDQVLRCPCVPGSKSHNLS